MYCIKTTATCLLFILFALLSSAQELNQTTAQWELRNSNNDPNIESNTYNKLRIKFKTATSISFTGYKGDEYPSSMVLEMAFKPTGIYILPLHLQVNKGGQWERQTIDLQVNQWGEVLTKNSEVIHKVFDDFKTGSKARVRIGYNGEDWYEFSLASFKTASAKVFVKGKPSVAETTPKRDEYGFPLRQGDQNNKYVEAIQKRLLPQNLWSGNYSNETTAALLMFIVNHKHEFSGFVGEDVANDYGSKGEWIPVWLYNMIVRGHNHQENDVNYDPKKAFHDFKLNKEANSASGNQSDPKTTAHQAQQTSSNKTQTTYQGSVVIRFPIHKGFGKASEEQGSMLYDLQNAVGAKPSDELDDQTFIKVKEFISNEEHKKLFGIDAPDSRDLSVLNNPDNPGITQRLYNIIIDLANQLDKRVVK